MNVESEFGTVADIKAFSSAMIRVADSVTAPFHGKESELEIEIKSDGTRRTDRDLISEARLTEEFNLAFPGSVCIGEEYASDNPGALEEALANPNQLVWIFDPIDGTNNYIHGLRYGMIVAGVMNGKTLLGGLCDMPSIVSPNAHSRKLLVVSHLQDHVTIDNQEVTLNTSMDNLSGFMHVNHFPQHLRGQLAANDNKSEITITRHGCIENEYMQLLMPGRGHFDEIDQRQFAIYSTDPFHKWDHLAGMLAVEKAGGFIMRSHSKKIVIVAASKEIADRVYDEFIKGLPESETLDEELNAFPALSA